MARTFPRRTADHSIIIERLVLFFTSPRTRLIRASPSISVFPSFRPGLFGHVRDDIRKWTESVSTNGMSQTILGFLLCLSAVVKLTALLTSLHWQPCWHRCWHRCWQPCWHRCALHEFWHVCYDSRFMSFDMYVAIRAAPVFEFIMIWTMHRTRMYDFAAQITS